MIKKISLWASGIGSGVIGLILATAAHAADDSGRFLELPYLHGG